MKLSKRIVAVTMTAAMLSLVVPTGLTTNTAEAAVKLSKTKLTLVVGKSASLSVKGTKKKVTWSSSKKTVATVTSKGKVTAVAVGNATITAKVNNKKYTCKVTVKAPFAAQKVKLDKNSFSIPKTWEINAVEGTGYITPKKKDETKPISSIVAANKRTSLTAKEMIQAKDEYFKAKKEEMKASGVDVSTFKTSTMKVPAGTVLVYSYTSPVKEVPMSITVYALVKDYYCVELQAADFKDQVKPALKTVSEYMLRTLKISK